MRARYYSPNMRRFINADIIAGELSNAITLNRYAYANGNPVSFIDPFGLSPWSWFKEKVLEPVGKGLAKAGKTVVDHVVKPIVNNVVKPVLDIGQKAFDYIATDFGEDVMENVVEPVSTFVEDEIVSPISEDVKAVDNWFDDVGDWLNKNALNSDGSYSLHDSLRNRRRKQGQTVLREQLLAFTPSDPSWNWSAEDFSVGLGSLSVDAMTGGWEGEYANLSLLDFGHAEVGLELKNGKFNVSTMASIWSPSFSVNIFGVNIKIGAEVGAVGLAAKGQFSAGKKEVGFSIGGGVGFSFNASW